MVKIISTDIQSQTISSTYSIYKTAILGAMLGLLFLALTLIIGSFVSSLKVSGDIAAILTALAGIIIMVKLNMTQPLIVAIASAMALWSLALLTNGLAPSELVVWNVMLYGLSYLLFSWLVRYTKLSTVIVTISAIIIVIRIIVSL